MIIEGDCLEKLKELPNNSFDALITDPPAGISFMGKRWDKDKGGRDHWIMWMESVMLEVLRVLKPGAHGLVWALPRTSHWTALACDKAGFEIRDIVNHIFGSGFPKSQNIALAVDKQAGIIKHRGSGFNVAGQNVKLNSNKELRSDYPGYEPPKYVTDEAKQWEGFGTGLKPAHEHWILIRKPLSEKTVAKNVLKHGTGALNIDASRIETTDNLLVKGRSIASSKHKGWRRPWMDKPEAQEIKLRGSTNGRFPANLILSHHPECKETCAEECAVKGLDDHSTGGASRFFYVAKASRKDRGATNSHPCVKSTKLMEYLIKLITPPNGKIIDPFAGSGSTLVAAKRLGFEFVGIEQDGEYIKIAMERLKDGA